MKSFKYFILCGSFLFVGQKTFAQQTNKPTSATQVGSATAITVPSSYGSGIKINYVRTKEAIAPITNIDTFNIRSYTSVKEATQYFDGLGRPLQTVIKQVTPGSSPKDLVTAILYDSFGREQYKYLPYAQLMNNNQNDGRFKLDPFSSQSGYYGTNSYNQNHGIDGENIYYSKTVYESSPLNRVLKAFAPGNSWAGSEGTGHEHMVEMQYQVNVATDSVRIWNITYDTLTYSNNDVSTNIPSSSLMYPAGELYKNVTIDEQSNKVVEYKDKEGKVILKKVQIAASPSDGHTGWLCTYYVYDDFNLLRFVISPNAVEYLAGNSWLLSSSTVINELCFRYEYDNRQRMIAKKVPGAGWVYMVNDKRDRPTFTQDAKMRTANQWAATLYDNLNRPITTGMITYSGMRSQLQKYVDDNFNTSSTSSNVSVNIPLSSNLNISNRETARTDYKATQTITFNPGFESETNASFVAQIDTTSTNQNISVQNNPVPSGGNLIALTITYYDNYSFTSKSYNTANNSKLDADENVYAESLPSTASAMVRGMATGTKVRVLENPSNLAQGSWLETVSYYDDQAKVIQVQTDNYKNGIDTITSRYDFTGKVITTYTASNNPAASAVVRIKTNMNYDHAGRLLNIKKTINDISATARYIARNEYDALGQLKTKLLGQKVVSGIAQSEPLDTLSYEYSIRGWLLSINKIYSKISGTNDRWFGMELNYDWGFDSAQFNGNITGIKWRSKGDGERRDYGFGYDKTNRLLFADFNQYSGSAWNKSAGVDFTSYMGDGTNYGTAYDANGNILKMRQWGLKLTASSVIDSLSYTYISNTNKLQKVNDGITTNNKLGDFTDNNTGDDYGYDVNGNMVADKNKRINGSTGTDISIANSGILYNYLNLPWKINVKDSAGNDKGTITYLYDAAGNKLQKKAVEGNKTTTTDYVNAFIYQNDTLQFFASEEGRIRTKNINKADTVYYDYFEKDHLGNIRILLTDEVKTDAYLVASLETTPLPIERNYYSGVDTGRVNKNTVAGYPSDTYTNPNDFIQKLRGDAHKVGTGIILKVMAGDKFNLRANSWYKLNGLTPGTPENPLTELIWALSGGISFANPAKGTQSVLSTSGALSPGATDFLNDHSGNYNTSKPKAFVNWILVDEQFKLDSAHSGFEQVGGDTVFTTHVRNDLVVGKNGYLYIYVSNETPNIDVFFDNLQITHLHGPLLEETHYYPFGLTMAGISSKSFGGIENKKGYNGNELQNKEFSDGSGLELYDFNARTYDEQIGKFLQIDPLIEEDQEMLSPYQFCNNDPIRFNDPDGKLPCCDFILDGLKAIATATVATVSVAVDNVFGTNATGAIANSGAVPTTQINNWNTAVTSANRASVVVGALSTLIGGIVAGGSAATTLATGGLSSEITVPTAIIGAGTAVLGAIVHANANRNLAKGNGLIRDKNAPPGTYDNKPPKREKNRVVDQKPGEAAVNQSDGINARQASVKKNKPAGAGEQNIIRDTKKSTNNVKNVNKIIKTFKDAEKLY
ncbi:MAG: cell well associated RhsD protein [Chitinophagaceae bacterium]|nr:cell well associated RhsD protein [Chitinophagaceae bacterium]